jgi:hypothetical protein
MREQGDLLGASCEVSFTRADYEELERQTVVFGYSMYCRAEWLFEVTESAPVTPFVWQRMANSVLTLAQITRDAMRLWRNSNRFLRGVEAQYNNEFAADGVRVGAQLRVRLPSDFRLGAPSVLIAQAHARSIELLRSWLTPVQLESFERTGSFEVVGGSSGVRYLLHFKYSFGIEPLEGRQLGSLLCVVPRNAPALGDILLAQKIGLETAERATLAKANVTSKRRYLQPEGA